MVVCDSLISKGIGKINHDGLSLKDVTVSTYYSIRTVTVKSWLSFSASPMPSFLSPGFSSSYSVVRRGLLSDNMTMGSTEPKTSMTISQNVSFQVLPLTMEIWLAFI